MKVSIGERLKEYMDIYKIRQTDIVMKCQPYCRKNNMEINKSTLNRYVNGTRVPKPEMRKMLAEVLHVSEAWLDGYDVPMDVGNSNQFTTDDAMILADIAFDEKLMKCIRQIKELSAPSKQKVYGYVEGLHDAES